MQAYDFSCFLLGSVFSVRYMPIKDKDKARAYMRAYQVKNAQRLKEQKKEYYIKNRAALLKQKSKYHKENKNKLKDAKNLYYEQNPDKRKERYKKQREWAKLNQEAVRAFQRAWRQRQPKEKLKDISLKHNYGITYAEVLAMVDTQGGCACCGTRTVPKRGWECDHDHPTDTLRGILCRHCNSGIGMLGDTIEGVRKALIYLENFYNKVQK